MAGATAQYSEKEYHLTMGMIMSVLLQNSLANDPVFQFLDKKRAEGKPYYVYMTAGANKFLRVYYGRVKEYLLSLESAD